MKEVICTTQEVQEIVDNSEMRIVAMIKKQEEDFNNRLNLSHTAIANSVSDFGSDIKSITKNINEFLITINEIKIWKAVSDTKNSTLEQKVDQINTTLSRVMWIIITAVIVAILALVIK